MSKRKQAKADWENMGTKPAQAPPDYFDDDCDDYDDDDWSELMCSMGSDGKCGQAGSEFCDFECKIMAAVRAEDRARAAHKAKKV